MARVFIPPPLRSLTDGEAVVEVRAGTVGDAVDQLEERHPGIRQRLVEDGRLRAGLSVTVDETVAARGLRQEIQSDSEIHFLPAIGGG